MALDNLENSLYNNSNNTVSASPRQGASDNINNNFKSQIPTDWSHMNQVEHSVSGGEVVGTVHSVRFKYFFIFSIVALLIALLFAYYQFKSNNNVVSGDQIMLTINTPDTLSSGDNFDIDYAITNNNKVKIVNTIATIQYSRGSDEEGAQDIVKIPENYISIEAGETKIGKVSNVLLIGKDDERRSIKLNLVYEVEGAAASFNKTVSKDIALSPMNVELSVSGVKEVREAEQFDTKVMLINNTNTTLDNYKIEMLYPNGFTFISSSPTLVDNKYFEINGLSKGEARSVTITGIQTGAAGEQSSIRANMYLNSDNKNLMVKANRSDYVIASDPVALSVSSVFDSKVVKEAKQGAEGVIRINWQNTLDEAITNMKIVLKLDSEEKIFDSSTYPEFQSVAAGAKGEINFPVIISGPNSVSLAAEASGVRLQSKDVGVLLGKAVSTLKVSTTTTRQL